MNVRERFQAVMNFQPFDRLPLVEWAIWWDKTVDRWRGEGLPADVAGRYDLYRHFGLDMYYQFWISSRRKNLPKPASHGGPLISSMDEYLAIRDRLFPRPAIDRDAFSRAAVEQRNGDAVIWFTLDGFFWFPRTLLGIEPHFYAFHDQPELLHRINEDLSDWMLAVIDEISEICVPDFMTFAEDMSYNHGPMLSKKQFNMFMKPYYDKVIPKLDELGILPVVDSDGDISMPAAWFRDAGIKGILPLERQAGVDVAVLREKFPDMRFIGCFDKMTMNRGEAAMRAEFERLLPVAKKGGLIISVDHQTPPGVSYKEYLTFLSLFREYADKAGSLG